MAKHSEGDCWLQRYHDYERRAVEADKIPSRPERDAAFAQLQLEYQALMAEPDAPKQPVVDPFEDAIASVRASLWLRACHGTERKRWWLWLKRIEAGDTLPPPETENKSLRHEAALVMELLADHKREVNVVESNALSEPNLGTKATAKNTKKTQRRGRSGKDPDERFAIIKALYDHETNAKPMGAGEGLKQKKAARNWLIRDWDKKYVDGSGKWRDSLCEENRIKLCEMRDFLLKKWKPADTKDGQKPRHK